MLQIVKEREHVTTTDYYLEFNYKDDPESGFWFPANKDHTPAFDKMSPAAAANYKNCLTDDRLTEAEFTTDTRTYIEPAVGKCRCGAEVLLDPAGSYMGAVSCRCGRWYNLFGQSLKEPRYWEEAY